MTKFASSGSRCSPPWVAMWLPSTHKSAVARFLALHPGTFTHLVWLDGFVHALATTIVSVAVLNANLCGVWCVVWAVR